MRGTFKDSMPDGCKLSSGSNIIRTSIPPRSLCTITYSLIPEKRGNLIIERLSVSREDNYGLLIEDRVINHQTALNVHTRKESFDTARRIAGREHLEYSGIARNIAIILREFEFDGIRDYLPGDNARDIYWKQYTKLGKLMTKVYKKEGTLQTTIFLDCGRSMRIPGSGISKIDHAIEISMQLSNVLLSSYHSAGIALFDEISVLKEIKAALGRHQFDKIVMMLRETPASIENANEIELKESSEFLPAIARENNSMKNTDNGELFIKKIGEVGSSTVALRRGMGLDGMIKNLIAKERGQKRLFITITDLISSRKSVLSGAKLCQITGNKMLIIHINDDWYGGIRRPLDLHEGERLYEDISYNLKMETAFRRMGARYIRIGPADSAFRIVREIRRGRA